MKTRYKQNIIAAIFCIIVIAFIGGCNSEKKEVQNDIINYVNVELPKISGIEDKLDKEYSSVTGTNYKDDDTTYKMIKGSVIPDSLKLVDAAEAITPKSAEVKAVHELYLSAINAQNSAFTMILSAIETQDSSKVSTANDKLAEARKGIRDYQAKLKELEDKYNVTIK